MVTPAARREAVAILVELHEMSERRACSVIGADRTSVHYRSRRPDDAGLRERMRTLAGERRRFGYARRIVGWRVGNIPPAEAEANFYAALDAEPMAA